jgi:hypothetical protein
VILRKIINSKDCTIKINRLENIQPDFIRNYKLIMKKQFLIIIVLFAFSACSKKQETLETFSAESFAYSMDNGWEMNASVRVKGFEQDEIGKDFKAKLSYSVDLETSDGKLIEEIDKGVVDKTQNEKMIDLQINSQLNLDSTYKTGTYKVTFIVKDEFTNQKSILWSFFELTK